MKIVRHIAPDMRQALRTIREQLGEDAVILSSRRMAEGVEVTAAVDFDATSLENAPAVHAYEPTHGTVPGAATQPAATSTVDAANLQTPRAAPPFAPVYAAPAMAGYSSTAPTAYSHAASSHYFPAPSPAAEVLPFAHILASEPSTDVASKAVQQQAPGTPTSTVGLADTLTTAPAAPTVAAAALPARTPSAAQGPLTAPRAPGANAPQTRREPTLNIAPQPKVLAAEAPAGLPPAPATAASGDAMGTELKTLRRMLETQLAQLAWNDLTRRSPVHLEILRELTEIGITQDLSDHILKQLPEKVELGFARRFAIAGLSQYLLVAEDRWLENGGRVAFIGATGVGKTTTLAKLAVRWVLRHGPRDLALVGSDTVRIGAQDQIQSLGQLLGVPVYTPENFESLPTLLSRLGERHRLILIDTPGSSLRDAQLASRLGVLSNCASLVETALVLAGSTQAGAIEETVKRFAPANPACCVLTKLDEAASLGGALSALIRARLPVSYVSEGQRVPEDLRPARALELVSAAVRLAKASGAAADEDLLRRRFGKTAHAPT
jgi:flagellar biosynthesis protein FlhF